MATIEHRNGKYRVRVRRIGHPPVTKTFDKRTAAQKFARECERAIATRESDTLDPAKLKVSDALVRYAREVTPLKRSAKQELMRIDQWLRTPIAKFSMDSLRGVDLAQHRDKRLREGLSANTIRLELAIISHLYTVARKDWGYESLKNPVEVVRKPSASPGRERRLENGELERLLEAADVGGSPYLAPLVLLAIETAMRQGELLGLHWKDINFDRRIARLKLTKNGQGRSVPLSRLATQILSGLPKDESRVFDATPSAVRQAFRRACARAKIRDLRFHDLRHEATSRLFEKGLNQMQVSQITGHKTLQMLQRYTHLRADSLVDLLD
ncbi:site-specific integrase [Litorisediminicola beolgyonensis]|uniref:Site-specific integrase n=1 Tax=Litorisediminicola beolgyonensis TaxID=1173614 RepID=A0ABW3ZH48_9RHOB